MADRFRMVLEEVEGVGEEVEGEKWIPRKWEVREIRG